MSDAELLKSLDEHRRLGRTARGVGTLLAQHAPIIAMGAVMEVLQGMVGRDADWLDEVANSLGALTGMGLALAYLAIPRRLVGGAKRD